MLECSVARMVIWLSRRPPGPQSASLRGLIRIRRRQEAGHRSALALEVVFGGSRCYWNSGLADFVRSEVVTDSFVAVVDVVDVKLSDFEDSGGLDAEGKPELESEVLVVGCPPSVILREVW